MFTRTPHILRSLRFGPVGQAFPGRFTQMPYLYSRRSFSKDPWGVLGVKKDASVEMAEKAYRKLAMMYHPNRPGREEEKYMEVSKAFHDISNGSRKKSFSRKKADQLFEETFGPDVARMAEKGGSFNIESMFNDFKNDLLGNESGSVKSEETLVSYATEKDRRVKITTKLRYDKDGEVLNRSVTKETIPPGTKEAPSEPADNTSSTESHNTRSTSSEDSIGQQSDHTNQEGVNGRRSVRKRERKRERIDQFDADMREMQQMADKEQNELQESTNEVFGTAQRIADKVSGLIFKRDGKKSRKKMD